MGLVGYITIIEVSSYVECHNNGKYFRQCIQSRIGYTMLVADWSSQELLTLALLLDNPEFTKSVNKADFHLDTGLLLYDYQKINISKVEEGDEAKIIYFVSTVNLNVGDKLYIVDPKGVKIEATVLSLNRAKITNSPSNIEIGSDLGFITYVQRQISKKLNFGLIYNEPLEKNCENLQMLPEDLQPIVDKWWSIFPHIKNFIKELNYKANINGYLETINGRRMYYPQLLDNPHDIIYNEEQYDFLIKYVNSGSAADWLRLSMIQMDKLFKEKGYDAHIVHTLHDEIIVEVADSVKNIVKDHIINIMTKTAIPDFTKKGINVKLEVDSCLWWNSCSETDTRDFIINS